jgi:hypothetical protein
MFQGLKDLYSNGADLKEFFRKGYRKATKEEYVGRARVAGRGFKLGIQGEDLAEKYAGDHKFVFKRSYIFGRNIHEAKKDSEENVDAIAELDFLELVLTEKEQDTIDQYLS